MQTLTELRNSLIAIQTVRDTIPNVEFVARRKSFAFDLVRAATELQPGHFEAYQELCKDFLDTDRLGLEPVGGEESESAWQNTLHPTELAPGSTVLICHVEEIGRVGEFVATVEHIETCKGKGFRAIVTDGNHIRDVSRTERGTDQATRSRAMCVARAELAYHTEWMGLMSDDSMLSEEIHQ